MLVMNIQSWCREKTKKEEKKAYTCIHAKKINSEKQAICNRYKHDTDYFLMETSNKERRAKWKQRVFLGMQQKKSKWKHSTKARKNIGGTFRNVFIFGLNLKSVCSDKTSKGQKS
mmetsp:Transcript_49019/g.78316  ORF Transcript_49019/g.78316 Transcript_49019/m.78316 type:complete len:115 (-) Transcript_49019:763-1107(-)